MEIQGIDVAALSDPRSQGHARAVANLREAASTTGAFGVEGHGLDPALVERAMALCRSYFELPLEAKERSRARGGQEGYHPRPASGDQREKLMRIYPRESSAARPWPSELPELAPTMDALAEAIEPVALGLIGGLATALELPREALLAHFENRGARAVWLLHYPAVPAASGARGQGTSTHTDFLPVGLILQDAIGGLELRDGEGRWQAVDPERWPLVCQLGDLAARWSNDVLKPNVHRVFNDPSHARYSILYSTLPSFETVVEPLPTCVSETRPARYPVATFGECLQQWLADLETGRAGYVAS